MALDEALQVAHDDALIVVVAGGAQDVRAAGRALVGNRRLVLRIEQRCLELAQGGGQLGRGAQA
ncbi:MAG TPA: hypothetical protein VN999_18350, partial [Thermoanaerobaculia bacterium]|nr:hypothetical protein [Thermoanaerobaculia bacterium]